MNVQIDGSTTLESQENSINFGQQQYSGALSAYTKNLSAPPQNHGVFEIAPFGQDVLPVSLIEVADGTSMGTIVAAQLALGKHLIFYNGVYVGGIEKKVAGFR